MKRIFFVRHGQTTFNVAGCLQGRSIDSDLNERGLQQAADVGKRLANRGIEVVFSSTLKRAIQTTAVIQRFLGPVAHRPLPELGEICWGSLEGGPVSHIEPLLRAWRDGDEMVRPPNGESLRDIRGRAQIVRHALVQSNSLCLLVIGHGRNSRYLIASLLGDDTIVGCDHFFDNGAIVCLDYDPDMDEFVLVKDHN